MAVAKQVQWQWSGTHDNQNCVILQGALHIEMVSMNIIGGCTGPPVRSGVTSVGTADSFLKVWSDILPCTYFRKEPIPVSKS